MYIVLHFKCTTTYMPHNILEVKPRIATHRMATSVIAALLWDEISIDQKIEIKISSRSMVYLIHVERRPLITFTYFGMETCRSAVFIYDVKSLNCQIALEGIHTLPR